MDKPKIVFLGTPRLAQIVLQELIDSPFKPTLVITGADEKVGRGQKSQQSPVAQTATKNNIPVSFNLDDIPRDTDLAILVAYGHIIPKNILEIPKQGFLNVHPSLLPKLRGPSPILSAILNGEEKTGVTIMKLDEELDHGPILAQVESKIKSTDTHESLTNRLGIVGADLLIETAMKYLDGQVKPKNQNHQEATYTEKITKQSGKIDINNLPDPEKLDRMIRAYFPWPAVWFEADGKRFKLLPEQKIQPEGKKPMSLREFQNGHPKYKYLIEKLV